MFLLTLILVSAGPAQTARPQPQVDLFAVAMDGAGRALIDVQPADLDRIRALPSGASFTTDLSLPEATLELHLQRFRIGNSATRVVLGSASAPIAFDPDAFVLLRGGVIGSPGSHAYLALSEGGSAGYVEFDGGLLPWMIRFNRPIRRAGAGGSKGIIDPPLDCPVNDPVMAEGRRWAEGVSAAARGQRVLELAVDTDHEYFQLFGDVTDAAAYAVVLYGAVSAIFQRDLDIRVELSYLRLWTTPEDRADLPEDLLWDAAQMLLGNANVAGNNLGFVCTPGGRSRAGMIQGRLFDPDAPSRYQWDLYVTAHELGHTCGSGHTHDYAPAIDQCPFGAAARGTIMSYCNRTSGGLRNYDFRYHARVRREIRAFLDHRECLSYDCNVNGLSDAADIGRGASADTNGNGVPDECEDCNANGLLDPADLADGRSPDVNTNGIPDECEADCNNNGTPDAVDIADGISQDANGDDIPDACQIDCDGDGLADAGQILADMTLDLDRDGVIDDCADCDGDGTPDSSALGSAHTVWLVTTNPPQVAQYAAASGVRLSAAKPLEFQDPVDLVVAGDAGFFIACGGRDGVQRFDAHGDLIGRISSPGSRPLSPTALGLDPLGRLLVASATWGVLTFELDGTFIDTLIEPGAGGLASPVALTYGPNGNLFVASSDRRVLEFERTSGAFVGTFVHTASGGLNDPRGLAFNRDGNLLVASAGTGRILEYHGLSGAFLGVFTESGMLLPGRLRVGPGGNLFVANTRTQPSGTGNWRVYEVEADRGRVMRHAFVGGVDQFPEPPAAVGFDFVRGWSQDCNFNHVPDPCDVSGGHSPDDDHSGVPDECELDCNGNGVSDLLDLIPTGRSTDCDFNGVPDECEARAMDCNANGVHDACEIRRRDAPDCDFNGVPDDCQPFEDCDANGRRDICDVAAASAIDCNANWIPDHCEADCDLNGVADDCDIDCGGDGTPDACQPDLPRIVGSEPANDAIDARQPMHINGGPALGWDHVSLQMSGHLASVGIEQFDVQATAGAWPRISDLTIAGRTVHLKLDRPIPSGAWTTIVHRDSCTHTRIGFLPGDVNGDGLSNARDILVLVDVLNGSASRPPWSTDIDRSGVVAPFDILRAVDLLNGAGSYGPWAGRTLP